MPTDEKTGRRYRVHHERAFTTDQTRMDAALVRSQKGGRTIVEILDDDDQVVAAGEAITHPSENYNRKLGRTIALGRALKQLRIAGPPPRRPQPRSETLTIVEFADLMRLAIHQAISAGLCYVHVEDNQPADFIVMSKDRYSRLIDRAVGEGGIPDGDPEWEHSHVEPEMIRDPAVLGR